MTTTTETTIQTKTIQITPAAAEIVRGLRQQQKLDDSYGLRVYISGQTCSGFQYGMALDNNPRPTDTVFEQDGMKLLVDDTSIQYMEGATIDYVDDQRGKGFLVENPNAAQACSCEGGSCDCGSSEN